MIPRAISASTDMETSITMHCLIGSLDWSLFEACSAMTSCVDSMETLDLMAFEDGQILPKDVPTNSLLGLTANKKSYPSHSAMESQ